MEKFLNRVWATLAAGITNVQTSITLTTGHGARFGTLAAGDKIRAVFIDAANNVEVIYITGIATDTLTVLRGQDGSTARAYSAGDRIEARIGKSTMEHLVQQSGEQTFSVAAGTADAMTAAFNPTLTELKDGQPLRVRAVGANTVTNPTINPDALGALTIYKTGGVALAIGDIVGAGHELQLTYRASPARLELDNPGVSAGASAALIHAATSKTTPVDADELPMADSAASFGLKKLTWANLKATLNTLYMALVAPGASGNVLTSNGSAWTSAAPPAAGVTSFNSRNGAVTLAASDITTIDGAGSGIDADLLDGQHASAFAVSGPSFFAYKTANQTINTATDTKVTFPNESFDSANCFDSVTNHRFTPNVAGRYIVTTNVSVTSGGAQTQEISIKKNGVVVATYSHYGTDQTYPECVDLPLSAVIDMNGSTDYLEIWVEASQGFVATPGGVYYTTKRTFFSAAKVG